MIKYTVRGNNHQQIDDNICSNIFVNLFIFIASHSTKEILVYCMIPFCVFNVYFILCVTVIYTHS